MLRQLFEIRAPGRVHGPVDLKGPADPIKEFLFSFFLRGLGCVVKASQTDTSLHEPAKLLQVIVLQCGMAFPTVAINDNRSRAVERSCLLRPAVTVHHSSNTGNALQAR